MPENININIRKLSVRHAASNLLGWKVTGNFVNCNSSGRHARVKFQATKRDKQLSPSILNFGGLFEEPGTRVSIERNVVTARTAINSCQRFSERLRKVEKAVT